MKLKPNFNFLGFTLFELLLVLFLMSLTLGLVIPRLKGFRLPEETFPMKVKDLLEEARRLSHSRKKNFLVFINPQTRTFSLFEAPFPSEVPPLKSLKVPERYEIKEEGLLPFETGKGLLFLAPDGFSSGGEIEIVDHENGKRFLLRVSSLIPLVDLQILK